MLQPSKESQHQLKGMGVALPGTATSSITCLQVIDQRLEVQTRACLWISAITENVPDGTLVSICCGPPNQTGQASLSLPICIE